MRLIIKIFIAITCVFSVFCNPSSDRKHIKHRSINYNQIEDRLEKLEQKIRTHLDTAILKSSANKSDENEDLDANFSDSVKLLQEALRLNNVEMKFLREEIEKIVNITTKHYNNNQLIHNYERKQLRPDKSSIIHEKPNDCFDIKLEGKPSGVYRIFPEGFPYGFLVLCDTETRGGGWTVIQNRYDGSQNFYLNYHDYRTGFGNLAGEFWLGLDNIHHLTGYEVNELLIELVDFTSTFKYAHYESFSIGSEKEGFSLKLLGNYEGNAGDSLIYQAGSRFSTKDVDRDEWDEGNCAKSHGGAWWYKSCDTSNLNGKYLKGELPENYKYNGMYWGGFRGALYSLKQARMMVRPRDKNSRGN